LVFSCVISFGIVTGFLSTIQPGRLSQTARNVLKDSSPGFSNTKKIVVTGNNFDITPTTVEYIEKKISNVLSKLGGDVTKVDCHLIVEQNPRIPDSHRADITIFTKGAVIRATEKSEHMYGTIDLVADRIARKLRKFKERRMTDKRGKKTVAAIEVKTQDSIVLPEEIEDSDVEDTYQDDLVNMAVVKEKFFAMPPMTVEDAVLCLEYIDHDFYVFRNEDSGEVNVVYKRNSGGVGLIQPEKV